MSDHWLKRMNKWEQGRNRANKNTKRKNGNNLQKANVDLDSTLK